MTQKYGIRVKKLGTDLDGLFMINTNLTTFSEDVILSFNSKEEAETHLETVYMSKNYFVDVITE